MKKIILNKKIRLILLIIIFVLIILISIATLKKEETKVKPEKQEEQKNEEKWYTPSGVQSKIKFYKENNQQIITSLKEGEINGAINEKDYKLIGNYFCEFDSCESFGVNQDINQVVIKDGEYILYDYYKNKARKLNLTDSKFNSIEILTFDNKVYGLSVSNINGFYAFYSLEEEKFTTDFKYTNVFNYDLACLTKNKFLASKIEGEQAKYYVVDFVSGKEVFASDAFIGSFGNQNKVYYYQNYAELDGYDAVILDDNFKQLFDGNRKSGFGVTKSGNLILKNDDNTFSVYNDNLSLVKKSKSYKQINLFINEYIVVVDNDDYLKIVDSYGNVKAKFDKMDNDKTIVSFGSGIKKIDEKNIIFISVEDITSGEILKYYYVLETKEKGIISNSDFAL